MRILLKTLTLAIILVLVTAAIGLWAADKFINIPPQAAMDYASDVLSGNRRLDGGRTVSELNRYLQKRLEGHTRLEMVLRPPLLYVQSLVERPIPDVPFPSLGKGQQLGQPTSAGTDAAILAKSPEDIRHGIKTLQAGQIMEILPGTYRLQGAIVTGSAGSAQAPILVRASRPGTVIIEFDTTEGFQIHHPYWIFENLVIKGACPQDTNCEHAFHIVGDAHHTTIRNNRIIDFNAHLKINGDGKGNWPDDGLVQNNTLTNTRPRQTHLPTTPIDLVGASAWIVADNVISNFVKGQGDLTSYGIMMKGGGNNGRIERNLIICTQKDLSQPGLRVGLSFGGGGTGKSYCRDTPRCATEHTGGAASNNIVAHCNDFGIDVNRSSQITVAHNTLINTSGIDVRQSPASVEIRGNLLDGYIRGRDGAKLVQVSNTISNLNNVFELPDGLNLGWHSPPDAVASSPMAGNDFCKRPRAETTRPGAFSLPLPCASPVTEPTENSK